MSLYVDWSKIEPPLTDAEKEGWAFATGVAMLVCDMAAIRTDSDVVEMYTRLCMFNRIKGAPPFVNGRGEDMNSVEYWRRWKGVAVNATTKPRKAFLSRVASEVSIEVGREAERELERLRSAEVEEAVTKVGEALNMA